jgi:hypothetical protein
LRRCHRAVAASWKKCLHEAFKRRIKTRTVLPFADTSAMLSRALLTSGQIIICKADGWQIIAILPVARPIELAA